MTHEFQPRTDLVETSTGFQLLMDLPGVAREDLKIEVNQGRLEVFGKAKRHSGRALAQEYGEGDFRRSFKLGGKIDDQSIAAHLEAGVLKLELPKTAGAQPVQIAVA